MVKTKVTWKAKTVDGKTILYGKTETSNSAKTTNMDNSQNGNMASDQNGNNGTKSPRAKSGIKPPNPTIIRSYSPRPSPRQNESKKDEPITKSYQLATKASPLTKEVLYSPILDSPRTFLTSCSYDTVPGLKDTKYDLLRQIEEIDSKLHNMKELKSILRKFSSKMKEFSAEIFKLDRNRQGVPFVANVKSLFSVIHAELNNVEIEKQIQKINVENVPFVFELNVQFNNLRRLCENIIVHHVHYHVTYLEDFHLVVGKLRGMMKSIIALYYNDESNVDDFLDKSFDDFIFDVSEQDPHEDDSDEELDCSRLLTPRDKVSSYLLEGNEGDVGEGENERAVTMKELVNLRKDIRTADDALGKIQRLSLGNPKIQSLRDNFALIGGILQNSNMKELKANQPIFAARIESNFQKMVQMSTIKSPSEKHIEQMKVVMGETDGRIMIMVKNLEK